MSDKDDELEQMIQEKGATIAPRVTPADIEANIAHVEYLKHVSKGGQVLRWAIITTISGYAVVAHPSVSVSPENDNQEIGEAVALGNAKDAMWPLMGYALKQQIHEGTASKGISEHAMAELREQTFKYAETEEDYRARRIVINVADLDKIPEVIAMNFRAAVQAVQDNLDKLDR